MMVRGSARPVIQLRSLSQAQIMKAISLQSNSVKLELVKLLVLRLSWVMTERRFGIEHQLHHASFAARP